MKTSYIKLHKRSIKKNFFNKKNNILFSRFIIKSLSYVRISYKQLESFRRVIVRKNFKFCFVLNKISTFFYLTKKSKKSRMGKGRGKLSDIIYNLKPGLVVIEVSGSNSFFILKSIKKALFKLPGFYKIFKIF